MGAYSNPVRFLAALPHLDATIFLLDINLPRISGLECLAEIRKFMPTAKVVMLTVSGDSEHVLTAFLQGADGYLLKEASRKQILEAIDDASNGGAPMSPGIARKVVGIVSSLAKTSARFAGSDSAETLLSRREYEILQLLAGGQQYKEIADQLGVSLHTIKTHISHIYEKLKVRNKAEAIARFRG